MNLKPQGTVIKKVHTLSWTSVNNFDLSSVQYDANGNITLMNCKSNSGADRENLVYSYSGSNTGNQLESVSGTCNGVSGRSGSFTYDSNGNVTSDGLRGIGSISWFDEVNRPKQYYKDAANKVDYSYDALGNKWSKTSVIASTTAATLYYGPFIYTRGTLTRVLTPEGYYNPATGNYYYYLKDHLGNNRITYHYSGSAPVIDQEVEYYPFGSMFAANNLQNNLYLYNGKELNNEFFENYDYGARFYDPQIGRWHVPDPLAESYRRWSPYNYAVNNPIRFIDPDGIRVDDYIFNKKGYFVRKEENNLPDKIVVENTHTGSKKSYELNDPNNDSKTLDYLTTKYGDKTQLLFTKTSKDLNSYIEKSGVNSISAQEKPLSYAYKESKNQGDMDNWAKYLGQEMVNAGISKTDINADRGGFFVPNGSNKAFNAMDFGNAVWGLEMMHLGFSLSTAKAGAHGHQLLIEKARYRRGGFLDSQGDQNAITSGYNTFSSGGAGRNW